MPQQSYRECLVGWVFRHPSGGGKLVFPLQLVELGGASPVYAGGLFMEKEERKVRKSDLRMHRCRLSFSLASVGVGNVLAGQGNGGVFRSGRDY